MDETFSSDGTLASPIKTVSKLSQFRVIGRLGYGSFSVVEKVQRCDDNIIYALKIVRMRNLSEKEKAAALNEVRILASFQSDHIVKYRESFYEKSSESLCIVMDFAGEDLSSKIKFIKNQENMELPNNNPIRIPEEQVWQYFIQGLKGLRQLHSAGVLHRDIKSANLFVSDEGILKIGDFNVCKATPRTKSIQPESEQQQQLMCRSQQTGTPYYTAPEVWTDGNYSTGSDIWSLGCVIFELCALSMPFQGSSLYQLAQNILHKPPKKLPQNCYSEELSSVIALCLNKNARERPTTQQLLDSSQIQKRLLQQSQLENLQTSCSHNTPKKQKHLQGQSNENPDFSQYLLDTIQFPSTISKFSEVLPANNYDALNSIPIVSEFNNSVLESDKKGNNESDDVILENPQDEEDPQWDHQQNKQVLSQINNSVIYLEININTPTKVNNRQFLQNESSEMFVSRNNLKSINLNKNIINPRRMHEKTDKQRRIHYCTQAKQDIPQELPKDCKKLEQIKISSKMQNTGFQIKSTEINLNPKSFLEQASQKINQIGDSKLPSSETIDNNNSKLESAMLISSNIPRIKTMITRQVRFIRQPLQQTKAESGESLTPSLSPGSGGRSKNASSEDSLKKRPFIASSYSPQRQFRISTSLSQVKNSPNRDQTKRPGQVSKFEQLFKRYLPNLYNNNNQDKQQNSVHRDKSINNFGQQKISPTSQNSARSKSPYEGALREVFCSQQTEFRTNRNQNNSKNALKFIEKRSKSNSSDQENKSQEGRKFNNLNNSILQTKSKQSNPSNNLAFLAPKKRTSIKTNGLLHSMKNESTVRTVKCDQSIIGLKTQQQQQQQNQSSNSSHQLHQYHHYQLSERTCSPARKIQMNSHSEREIPLNSIHQTGSLYLKGVQKVVYPIMQQQYKYPNSRNSNEQSRPSSSTSFIQ